MRDATFRAWRRHSMTLLLTAKFPDPKRLAAEKSKSFKFLATIPTPNNYEAYVDFKRQTGYKDETRAFRDFIAMGRALLEVKKLQESDSTSAEMKRALASMVAQYERAAFPELEAEAVNAGTPKERLMKLLPELRKKGCALAIQAAQEEEIDTRNAAANN